MASKAVVEAVAKGIGDFYGHPSSYWRSEARWLIRSLAKEGFTIVPKPRPAKKGRRKG